MTLDDLYDLLEPIATDVVEEARMTDDPDINAANVILCMLMHALSEAMDGEMCSLIELATVCGVLGADTVTN